eukprot:360158-Chlamydomonas_euryale.AAC.3
MSTGRCKCALTSRHPDDVQPNKSDRDWTNALRRLLGHGAKRSLYKIVDTCNQTAHAIFGSPARQQ